MSQTVEGFCGIFCLMCEALRKYPSVTCGDSSPKGEPECKRLASSAQGTPCGCPKGEPKCKKSLPFRGGEPAKLVEGFSVKSFA